MSCVLNNVIKTFLTAESLLKLMGACFFFQIPSLEINILVGYIATCLLLVSGHQVFTTKH